MGKNNNIKNEIINNYGNLIDIFEYMQDINPSTKMLYNEFKIQFNELRKKDYEIAITGTVSSGKSSFINALLGRGELLPRRKKATTNVATYIKHINRNQQGLKEGFTAKIFEKIELNINRERKKLIKSIKEEKEYNQDKILGFLLSVINSNNDKFFEELISADFSEKKSIDFKDKEGKDDKIIINIIKRKCNSLSNYYNEKRQFFDNYYNKRYKIKEINGSLDEAGELLEHNDKNHNVKSITLFCDASILEKGITLIDLPGSDNKNKKDKEITHGILESDSISAAVFLYEFGKDPREEDEEISNIINNNILKKKNKLFIVFNKTDLGLKNSETLNDHRNLTIPYFDRKLNGNNTKKINYYYLSCAIHEGLSFALTPNGDLKNTFSEEDIFQRIKDLAKKDINNIAHQKSEQYGAFFEALEQYFEKIINPNKSITASNYQGRVIQHIKIAKQSNNIDFKKIFNIAGINNLMPFISNNHEGMGNFHNQLFTYLSHERTKDSYKKVGKAWDEFAIALDNELAEKTKDIRLLGKKEKWSKKEAEKLKDTFNKIRGQAVKIATSFHQDKINDIKDDISNLVTDISDKLNSNIDTVIDELDFDKVISSLESDYFDYSNSSSHMKNIFKQFDIDLSQYGEKQKYINIYYEDVLLYIINTISLLIKLKSIEYSKEIPIRLYDVFFNWFWSNDEIDNLLNFFDNLKITSRDDLRDIMINVIVQDNYIEKIFPKIEAHLSQLYNRPEGSSIYTLLLNEEVEKSDLIDFLSSSDKEELRSVFLSIFEKLNNKQIEDGIKKFENNIQRFFSEWPTTDLKSMISDIFQINGTLYTIILEKQKVLLDDKYDEKFGQLENYCSLITQYSDDIMLNIYETRELYRQIPELESLLANELPNMCSLTEQYAKIN